MKLSRFRPAIIALLCSAGFLHADIVVLKDGTRLEGTITDEKPDRIHMRYKLTPKIWDDKDIMRADIVDIIKQKPEEVELIELRKELPTPDLMTAEKYENLIQDRLRPFVNRYPGSKEAAEAEKMIAQLQEEKERVVAGGIKMEGKWLSPEEAKGQSYNIKAYEIYAQMHAKAVAKDYAGALKEFERMAPSSSGGYYGQQAASGYTLSPYYPKAVEEIIAVLTNYQAQVEQMIKDQPTLIKMREEGLKKLIEPDLSRTKSAIDREKEQWKSGYEVERKGSKWFTPYKYDLASLKILSTSIIAEKTRLKTIDVAKISKLNEIIGRIMQAMPRAGKDAEALRSMREAITEGQEAASGLDQQAQAVYNQTLQGYTQYYMLYHQQLTAQSTQAALAPGMAAPGGSTAIGGTATPGMDDRVAAALAAAGGAQAPATGAAPVQQPGGAVMPQTGSPAQQPGGAPVQGAMPPTGYPAQQQPGGMVQPQGYPQQPQLQPQAQAPYGQGLPQAQAPMPGAPAAEEAAPAGLSTNTLIVIGIGVVVLVLVVAMSGGKKKRSD
ncbi:MAG: PTPDL family protein [Prosthecobacter sp.]